MASPTLFNRDLFQSFFGQAYDLDKISDDTIEQFFSSDGIKLNYKHRANIHIRMDCKGVARQVDGVWHLFVRCTRTTYRNNGLRETSTHDFAVYDFYKGQVKGRYQIFSRKSSPEFVAHPLREITHHIGLTTLLEGMEKNDPDLKGKAADPVIPNGTSLNHGFRKVFQHAPELIPGQTKATPEKPKKTTNSPSWAKALSALAVITFLGLAVAWKQGYLKSRSVTPLKAQ